MSLVSHVIWDWNGTLFDDTNLCWEICQVQVTEQGGVPPSFAEFRRIFSIPVNPMWDTILKRSVSAQEYLELGESFHRRYVERRHSCSLHQSARNVLGRLSKRGITQSILSSHPQKLLEAAVDLCAIREQFIALQGHPKEGGTSKIPSGREHMAALSLDPKSTILVGDTVHDYELARALGVRPILFSGGAQCPSRFSALDADVIHELEELLPLLE